MALRSEAIPIINLIIIPTLEKIIRSSSWRKTNYKLIRYNCKAVHKCLSKNITHPNTEFILNPLILACKSHNKKFAAPALTCFHKLMSRNVLTREADSYFHLSSGMLFQVIEAICTCHTFIDDAVELLMVNALLSAMTSTSLKIKDDCLLLIARTSYDLHLKSKNVVNQNTATKPLVETLLKMVYKRMEKDCSTVTVQPVFVVESMDSMNTSQCMKGFIAKVSVDGTLYKMIVEQRKHSTLLELIDDVKYWDISVYQEVGVDDDSEHEVHIANIQKRCSLVYDAFCKLPMKMHPKDDSIEASTELLKIFLENATAFLPMTDRMLNGLLKCFFAILKFMGPWMNTQLQNPYVLSAEVYDGNTSYVEGGNGTPSIANYVEVVERMSIDSHSVSLNRDSKVAALDLVLQEGINIFNQCPKEGIEFLLKANKIGNEPEKIAAFLTNTHGLNKTAVGDFIGGSEDLSLKVMNAYVESRNFKGMEFDEAIRTFLQGFRLPGEAQQIDRIMEKFAKRFHECNPNAFSSADTAYVLAYSIIMLNTDAHNPAVKHKMSANDFIKNNRGIDNGKSLPKEYMRSLYERIKRNEIKMKDDDLTSRRVNSYKRSYFAQFWKTVKKK